MKIKSKMTQSGNGRFGVSWMAVAFLFFLSACAPQVMVAPDETVPVEGGPSIVRVTATRQGYIFNRPWQQQRSVNQTAIGVIVQDGLVLVSGVLVANQRYIELETLDTRRKAPAEVVVVDYEANLALLRPLDADFLVGRKPMALAKDVSVGDDLSVWQVKPNGDVVAGTGKVTSVELGLYFQDNFFLTYHINNSLPYRFNNLTCRW
jgi:S1-C subfamily serine protease